jgi:hypothetical protein
MKLAYRLLLVLGHTLGDLALPLMRRQCERVGASMDDMSPEDAVRLLPALERVLEGFVARPKDLDAILHELKVEIGEERFARAVGEGAPGRPQARTPKSAQPPPGG